MNISQAQPETGPPPQAQEDNEARRPQPNYRRFQLLILGSSLCTIVGLVYYSQQKPPAQSTGIKQPGPATPCLSSACQEASARLSSSADPFARPCDYFLFTCGSNGPPGTLRGRQRGKGVPEPTQSQKEQGVRSARGGRRRGREERGTHPNRSLTEPITLSRETALLRYLREILDSDHIRSGPAVQKARGFYHSCLDTRSIETAGAEPFLSLIQKLGGWAVSGKRSKTDFNTTLALLMKDYSTFPFFNLYVGKDRNEPAHGRTKNYIQIDQPDLLIPIEWSTKTNTSKAKAETLRPFLASCERYLALLGAPSSTSIFHVGPFMSLSSELAVTASPLPYRLHKGQLYQRITIRELQAQAPAIDWLASLQSAFHPHTLSPDEHVILHNLPYIVQMSGIIGKRLNKQDLSSSDSLHTYMVLNLLHTFIPALDSRFTITKRNFSIALGNAEREAPRWEHCIRETEKGFDTILTHLLYERTAHQEVEEIIHNIFSSFKSHLADLKWRKEKSRQYVMNKVQSLSPRVLAKTEIPSEADLNRLFSKVSIYTNEYFSNYIQLMALQRRRRNKLFSGTEDVNIFSVAPFILGNQLIFPMGMFVPPLFHPTYPRAMNYGVLGSLMAKDILRLLLPDIHSQSETVKTVSECVWGRYITATEGPGRVGAFSLSPAQLQEMWVQYSALKIAFRAYHQSLKRLPGDASLSGLSHSHLFLSSFSQINCDSDPYREFMPFEPSFMTTIICTNSDLCPTSLACPSKTQQHSLKTC